VLVEDVVLCQGYLFGTTRAQQTRHRAARTLRGGARSWQNVWVIYRPDISPRIPVKSG
jgi:hypothetical protein